MCRRVRSIKLVTFFYESTGYVKCLQIFLCQWLLCVGQCELRAAAATAEGAIAGVTLSLRLVRHICHRHMLISTKRNSKQCQKLVSLLDLGMHIGMHVGSCCVNMLWAPIQPRL